VELLCLLRTKRLVLVTKPRCLTNLLSHQWVQSLAELDKCRQVSIDQGIKILNLCRQLFCAGRSGRAGGSRKAWPRTGAAGGDDTVSRFGAIGFGRMALLTLDG
jgi:hypothetical protein